MDYIRIYGFECKRVVVSLKTHRNWPSHRPSVDGPLLLRYNNAIEAQSLCYRLRKELTTLSFVCFITPKNLVLYGSQHTELTLGLAGSELSLVSSTKDRT